MDKYSKNDISKRKVFSSFIWRLCERSGAQIISFAVSIVLARILDPDTYGTLALVMAFISILNVFVDGGLGSSLIQKENADNDDFSTVFYANLIFCVVLYGGLFVAAPLIAGFYNQKPLTAVIRVIGITIIISGVKNIQQAYVSRNLLFKRFFFSSVVGTIISAFVGILLALTGAGIWALVVQSLLNNGIDTLILWITVKWRPDKVFSIKKLKENFSYGWKILAAGLVYTSYENLRQLLIGKFYTSSDLAYYNRGEHIPAVITANINSALDSVLLPTMSKVQSDRVKVKGMTRRFIQITTFVIMPMMVGLAIVASQLIRILLTEKWIECVPYMRMFCLVYCFYPIHTANLNAIKAIGRSDIFLKLEIIKIITGVFILLVTIWYGPLAIAFGYMISTILAQLINSWPNKELLNYSFTEQIKDILPNILVAFCMGIVVWSLPEIESHIIVDLGVKIIVGIIVYIALSFATKNESLYYLLNNVKIMVRKQKKNE